MAPKKKLLDKMKANPKADWTILNIEKVCRETGLVISPPSNGSHYKISSPVIDGILTVPARRPVKPVYISQLVALCEAHAARISATKAR